MRIIGPAILAASLCFYPASSFAQALNGCDLNSDGAVNVVDVQLGVDMSLGIQPCTASLEGPGVCNSDVVSRISAAVLGGGCNAHYVSLNWNSSTSGSITGYNVYRAGTTGGPYTKLNSSLVVGTTYSDSSPVAGQTYYYVTTAVNSSNMESSYSNQVIASIPANTHYAALTWAASTSGNISGYNVYRGSTTGGPYSTKVNSSLVAGTSFTDSSTAAGQTYYYVTTAVNSSNTESSYSNEAKAVIPTP